ncbi:MAG: hypothetical protein DI549_10740 [Ancylobacter novellus]|uniref:Uncharacterized protein n=1 Tax=Ancylobacter novellus TaxID=921 RepID=A0A2W5T8A9_ANCNO|nr:MAG: hypothetical protein DI549_10740 [Ancylobacter novellus]
MTMMAGVALGALRNSRRAPLDGYSDVRLARSDAIKLRSANDGPCKRIRLASGVMHDIGWAGNRIDRADLDSKIAGTSAWGVTIYDQSPFGRHSTQSTAAAQPRIASGGVLDLLGGLPADRYGLASGMGYAASGLAMAQPFTVIMTWMAAGAAPSSEHTLLGRDGTGSSYIYAPGSQVRVQAGAQVIPAGFTVGTPQLFGFVFNGAASRAVVNGVASGALNAGTDALTSLIHQGYNPLIPARVLNGYMPELIIMGGALATADIINIQRAIGAPRGIVIP